MVATERLDRQDNEVELMNETFEAWQSGIHTAMPGIVQSFDSAHQTCTVQPALLWRVTDQSGRTSSVALPLLVDVPVIFPGGGGYLFTFPVRPGDSCWVVFGERCIDAWWQSGGVQEQAEYRLHDLSDAVALVGIRPQTELVTGGINMSGPELRTDSGSARLRLEGDCVVVVAPGGVTYDTPTITVTGDVIASGISLVHHTHPGCQGGSTGQSQ